MKRSPQLSRKENLVLRLSSIVLLETSAGLPQYKFARQVYIFIRTCSVSGRRRNRIFIAMRPRLLLINHTVKLKMPTSLPNCDRLFCFVIALVESVPRFRPSAPPLSSAQLRSVSQHRFATRLLRAHVRTLTRTNTLRAARSDALQVIAGKHPAARPPQPPAT